MGQSIFFEVEVEMADHMFMEFERGIIGRCSTYEAAKSLAERFMATPWEWALITQEEVENKEIEFHYSISQVAIDDEKILLF